MVKDRILVGGFGAPRGAGGELRLTSFTGVPGAIAAFKPLFDERGTRRFSILSLRPIKDNMFVAKIAGVGDRPSAGALINAALYVPRASLPDVEGEEFYLADLVGLAAMNEAGEALGSVVNVLMGWTAPAPRHRCALTWPSVNAPTERSRRLGI